MDEKLVLDFLDSTDITFLCHFKLQRIDEKQKNLRDKNCLFTHSVALPYTLSVDEGYGLNWLVRSIC